MQYNYESNNHLHHCGSSDCAWLHDNLIVIERWSINGVHDEKALITNADTIKGLHAKQSLMTNTCWPDDDDKFIRHACYAATFVFTIANQCLSVGRSRTVTHSHRWTLNFTSWRSPARFFSASCKISDIAFKCEVLVRPVFLVLRLFEVKVAVSKWSQVSYDQLCPSVP